MCRMLNHPTEERELKLVPEDPLLLDRLAAVERLGPFMVAGRRHERQRNAFFDTPAPEHALRDARLAFRRRIVEGQALALWTLKGAGSSLHGVSIRPEVEVHLAPDTAPTLALATLIRAARERGTPRLADPIDHALTGASPRSLEATPYLETATDRRILDLAAEPQGWRAELALDRMGVIGHPGYQDVEIEIELRRGGPEVFEAARWAISALGMVWPSIGTKLTRALAHVRSHPAEQACRPRS